MTTGRIRLVATDVDGVLTDGTLYYGETGEALKAFHVRDGFGLKRLLERGVEVALVTARSHPALARRAADLGIRHVREGRADKWAALEELLGSLGIPPNEVAYVGDDVLDLAPMRRVGLAVAVADAHPSVKAVAAWVTEARGGQGALREVADRLLAGDGFQVVIPARYGSTRLPGKPLRLLQGRPLVAHVWERAKEAGATDVVVATDDARIADAVTAFGGRAIMTSPDHPSGTDRLAEVAAKERWDDDQVLVNLQGDEPLIAGAVIRRVADALRERPGAGIATLATPIREANQLFDPNVVKVVLDGAGMARWFSRAPLPWVRGAFDGGPPKELPTGVTFLRHVGLYAYRVGVVRRLATEPARPHERAELLEQLRALDLGIGIAVSVLEKAPGAGVDTEADLARVERELEGAVS